MLGIIAIPAHADLWNVYGGVSLETEYSGNKRLTTTEEDAGFQSIADLEIVAARVDRTNSITASVEVEAVRYNGIDFLNDEENLVIKLAGEHDASRRVVLGWYGQFARETTSNRQPRERSQIDENSDFNVDIGLTREQFRTKDFSGGPNITWRLTENLSLNASYQYTDVSFPERATTDFSFFDFDQHVAQLRASYELNPRHSISLSARGSRTESSGFFEDDVLGLVNSDVDSDSIAGVLGYRFDLAKNAYLGVNVGFEDVDTNTGLSEFDLDTTQLVYRAFTNLQGKSSRLLFSIGRSIAPSGIGFLLRSDLARLVYSRRLSTRQSLRLRASYLSNKPIGVLRDVLDREFFVVEPTYRYDISRQLSLDLSYRFVTRELRVEGVEADNHAVSAKVRYRFGKQNPK